jgi:hypothetical protein
MTKADPVIKIDEGPVLTPAQSYVLRTAAIEACERIISHEHNGAWSALVQRYYAPRPRHLALRRRQRPRRLPHIPTFRLTQYALLLN